MQYTSERIIPEFYSSKREYILFRMHIESYLYLSGLVKGKKVLDLGCGLGYGSRILADSAESVIGADVSSESIETASKKYLCTKLSYRCVPPADIKPLPFEDESFDVIVTFQVLEHLADPKFFISQLKRILKKDGILFIATPNRDSRLLRIQHPWNHHHIKEYSFEEISGLCRKEFKYVSLYGLTLKKEYSFQERRRVRTLSILSLPFTLKLIPNKIRMKLMSSLWNLANIGKKTTVIPSMELKEENVICVNSGFNRKDFNILAECRKVSEE